MRTFKGGVHPHDFKELSKDKPIEPFPAPDLVVLPMSQHIGVPCVPTVKKGDQVLKGQVVGQPDPENPKRFVSAPVHASVSGKVVAVEPRPHPLGKPVLAVVVENDGQDSSAGPVAEEADPFSLEPGAMRERIQAAGVVGMGGAAFPTHVKLTPPADKPIDTVILNAAECEPYLTCDYRLMLERPAELIEGLRIIGRVLGARDLWVGVEANKPDAFETLRQAASGTTIRVELCKVKYPQGAEKQLIYALTGRRVPAGGLPLEVGVVVQNVATALAIRDAVRRGTPLVQRVVTVTGDGVARPTSYLVRLGTPFQALLEAAGLDPSARKIIAGGPMMGIAQSRLDVPVIKGTSGILVLREAVPCPWRACIHCGRCVEACPMRLVPSRIGIACESGDLEAVGATSILDCFECGCCTYVCPAKRPIVHWVKWGKAELARKRAERQGARAS